MIGILIGCTRKLLLLLETTNRYRIIDNINKSIIGNKLKANSRLLAVLIQQRAMERKYRELFINYGVFVRLLFDAIVPYYQIKMINHQGQQRGGQEVCFLTGARQTQKATASFQEGPVKGGRSHRGQALREGKVVKFVLEPGGVRLA